MSEGKTFGFYTQTQWLWNEHLFNDVTEKAFKWISRLDLNSSICSLGSGFSPHEIEVYYDFCQHFKLKSFIMFITIFTIYFFNSFKTSFFFSAITSISSQGLFVLEIVINNIVDHLCCNEKCCKLKDAFLFSQRSLLRLLHVAAFSSF